MAEPLAARVHASAVPRDFEAWVKSEQRRVFLLCQRMLGDREEADSATQDVFLKAFKALQQPDAAAIDDAAKWLTRIAVNTCLDRLRSKRWQFWRKRPKPEDEAVMLTMAPATGPTAEDELFAQQIQQRLTLALGRLSERQRAVFTLRHYEDLSLDEIGQTLGLDTGTVKAHLFRAVGKLRDELRDLYERRPQAAS